MYPLTPHVKDRKGLPSVRSSYLAKAVSTSYFVIGLFFSLAVFSQSVAHAQVIHEDSVKKSSNKTDDAAKISNPMGVVLGLRAGVAIPSKKVLRNTGNETSIGPLVNAEALYAVREWVRLGLMLEWHQHSIDLWGPKLGTLGVFSILPTAEFRPTRKLMKDLGWESFVNYGLGLNSLIPYAAFGIGANVHSFSNSNETPNTAESFSTTLALRAAAGFDIALNSRWSFNTEVAWNRDSGTYTFNGVEADFDASSLNVLVGVRLQF